MVENVVSCRSGCERPQDVGVAESGGPAEARKEVGVMTSTFSSRLLFKVTESETVTSLFRQEHSGVREAHMFCEMFTCSISAP